LKSTVVLKNKNATTPQTGKKSLVIPPRFSNKKRDHEIRKIREVGLHLLEFFARPHESE
jgi:hypothetical protein